jgi:ankyrin repeat protein
MKMKNDIEASLYNKFKDSTQKEINDAFVFAAFQKNIGFETIRYLLTSPNLNFNADIHHCDDQALIWACTNGDFRLVKFLLSSTELKEHININSRDGYAFRWACENEYMDIVKYLLSSTELKEHVNIHSQNDEVFKICYKRGYIDMVKYFIFDLNMQKTPEIENFLLVYQVDFLDDFAEEVNTWFANQKFQNELKNELGDNSNKDHKKLKL